MNEIEQMRGIRELLIKALVVATGASEEAIREAPLTEAIKFRKTFSDGAQRRPMAAQGALEIAANIAEDQGWLGKPYPGTEIAKAIRDVAKRGYWIRDPVRSSTDDK